MPAGLLTIQLHGEQNESTMNILLLVRKALLSKGWGLLDLLVVCWAASCFSAQRNPLQAVSLMIIGMKVDNSNEVGDQATPDFKLMVTTVIVLQTVTVGSGDSLGDSHETSCLLWREHKIISDTCDSHLLDRGYGRRDALCSHHIYHGKGFFSRCVGLGTTEIFHDIIKPGR